MSGSIKHKNFKVTVQIWYLTENLRISSGFFHAFHSYLVLSLSRTSTRESELYWNMRSNCSETVYKMDGIDYHVFFSFLFLRVALTSEIFVDKHNSKIAFSTAASSILSSLVLRRGHQKFKLTLIFTKL